MRWIYYMEHDGKNRRLWKIPCLDYKLKGFREKRNKAKGTGITFFRMAAKWVEWKMKTPEAPRVIEW